jgi:hypothetical protein
MKARNVWTAWTRIQEGDYSPDDLARMLLRASGSYQEAKKALTRADNDPRVRASMRPAPGSWPIASGVGFTSDDAVYLAANQLKNRLGCSDHTALKKLLGGKYRVYWDKLKARDQTLEQIARLVQNPPDKS